MTLPKTSTEVLSQEEWDELVALKEAITYAPQTVSAEKMAEFIVQFALTGHQWMNGKIIPVSLSTP